MKRSRRQDGFTLVEVILALALLGAVMISVSGLFAVGINKLKGGRGQSAALSVARDIMEEMQGWHFDHLYSAFGEDGSAAAYTLDTRTNAFAAQWQPAIDGSLGQDAYAEIVLQSVDGTLNPPNLAEASCTGPPARCRRRAIKVEVRVHWREGERERNVALATIRI
jgi:prepilin-type N-terminal cleavage/methylation domain-containing protein